MFRNKKVRKALIDKELTIGALAKITGFTREHISGVISGRVKSIRAQKIIALALKQKPEEIWDDWSLSDASGEN